MKLFSQATAYDKRSDVLAWCMTITAWECRTERTRINRARSRKQPKSKAVDNATLAAPQLEMELEEDRRLLRQCLEHLAEPEREALMQSAAGVSLEAAMRKRKQRGLAKLRDIWNRLHDA